VMEEERLRYVLFAGPMTHVRDTVLDLDDSLASSPARGAHDDPGGPATPARTRVVRLLLLQLGARLCNLTSLQGVGREAGQGALSRVASIRHFLGANYGQPITLDAVARHVHLSPDRTRHVVRQEFGLTFRGLLRKYRLDGARALLLNTRLSVGEIAIRCGFGNHSSFTRLFTTTYGCSPSRWRREHQG
jgi:AraC-like DNA-binding protein